VLEFIVFSNDVLIIGNAMKELDTVFGLVWNLTYNFSFQLNSSIVLEQALKKVVPVALVW
jgi:hypothetical protein